MTNENKYGQLIDYQTGATLRAATKEETCGMLAECVTRMLHQVRNALAASNANEIREMLGLDKPAAPAKKVKHADAKAARKLAQMVAQLDKMAMSTTHDAAEGCNEIGKANIAAAREALMKASRALAHAIKSY